MSMLRAGIAWKLYGKTNLHTVASLLLAFLRSNEPETDGFGIRNFGIGTTHKLYNAQPDYYIVGSSSRLYLRFPGRQRPSLAD